MKRGAKTLGFGAIGGVIIAIGLGWERSKPVDSPVPQPVPMLDKRGAGVANWVDRGLLRLAEVEVEEGSDEQLALDAGAASAAGVIDVGESRSEPLESLMTERDELYRALSFELGVPEAKLKEIRAIVEGSPFLGQGNPAVTRHPMTKQQCRARRAQAALASDDERICGATNMVALFDPGQGEAASAKLCIDQFEFPNIACEYPVVWVRASEAARLCRLLDKRLCDAHEWEGACAGKLRSPAKEYESWVPRMQAELFHNQGREPVWAPGFHPTGRTCATGAQKSPGCVDASWEHCGTNTYPAGAFPRCVSPFGVYDLHGNVAEHMSLPLNEAQLGARGGVGETEMKGSWFAFDEYHPHPDDCRWRAPAWHATAVDMETSHFNYHLGFRCCRDLE